MAKFWGLAAWMVARNDGDVYGKLRVYRLSRQSLVYGPQQIENRINYKRAIKMSIASALRMGTEGIKVKVAGRLGGAEIARTEEIKQGRVPLHTFRMDIDYANVFALTVYGKIGIKVWICKGEVLGKRDLNPNVVAGGGKELGERQGGFDRREDRRDDRRGGGGGNRGGGGGNRRW